jgi:hypothetical protein
MCRNNFDDEGKTRAPTRSRKGDVPDTHGLLVIATFARARACSISVLSLPPSSYRGASKSTTRTHVQSQNHAATSLKLQPFSPRARKSRNRSFDSTSKQTRSSAAHSRGQNRNSVLRRVAHWLACRLLFLPSRSHALHCNSSSTAQRSRSRSPRNRK